MNTDELLQVFLTSQFDLFLQASFRAALPAPSVPTRILQLIFLSVYFPSLRWEAVKVTDRPVALILTHSCPINNSPSLTGSSSRPSGLQTWKLRSSSFVNSSLINLYWDKCATETGLATFSKSGDKQQQLISPNLIRNQESHEKHIDHLHLSGLMTCGIPNNRKNNWCIYRKIIVSKGFNYLMITNEYIGIPSSYPS